MLVIATLAAVACTSKEQVETAGGEVATTTTTLTDVNVGDYDLDMEKMRKWLAGTKALMTAAQTDSSIAEAIASSGNETTQQSIAKLESHPKANEILRQAGITPRDYVMTMTAYLQAAMVDAAMRASPQGKAPADVNPKNVEFIRKHQAELAKMMKDAGMGG